MLFCYKRCYYYRINKFIFRKDKIKPAAIQLRTMPPNKTFELSIVAYLFPRVPLKHRIADRMLITDILCLNQCIIFANGKSFFFEIFSASLLKKISASLPQPPSVEKTRGENEPCSISITRLL